jgi:hypothetical protein
LGEAAANFNNTSGDGVATLPRNNSNNNEDVDDDVNVVGQVIDFEIVGLFSSTNGRVDNKWLSATFLGVFKWSSTLMVEQIRQSKWLKVLMAVIDALLDFVPRVQSRLRKVVDCLDKLAVVCELYSSSNKRYKKREID